MAIDRDKLCNIGKREYDAWIDDYMIASHPPHTVDEAFKVFFRPFKHIKKCKICSKAKRVVGVESKSPHKSRKRGAIP